MACKLRKRKFYTVTKAKRHCITNTYIDEFPCKQSSSDSNEADIIKDSFEFKLA